MANIDQAESVRILTSMFTAAAYTAPPAVYAAIDTQGGTVPTSTATGTEASGQGYARAALTSTVANGSGGNAGLGVATSNAALNYTNMPAGTYGYIELFTTATLTTRRLWYGTLATAKTLASGDTLSIAAGQFTATLG